VAIPSTTELTIRINTVLVYALGLPVAIIENVLFVVKKLNEAAIGIAVQNVPLKIGQQER